MVCLTPLSSGGTAVRIAVSSADSNRLFVTFKGLWGNHLYYTTNGGSSWTQPASMDEQNADGWVCGSTLGMAGSLGIDNSSAPIAFHPTNGNIALNNWLWESGKKDYRWWPQLAVF